MEALQCKARRQRIMHKSCAADGKDERHAIFADFISAELLDSAKAGPRGWGASTTAVNHKALRHLLSPAASQADGHVLEVAGGKGRANL